MNQIQNQFTSIQQVAAEYLNGTEKKKTQTELSFDEVLKAAQDAKLKKDTGLKFSKHAAMRLSDRKINLTDEQSLRLENGVTKASEKGINESLVLVDSLAFIVNIPKKTVVTAIDQEESNSNIFTNIDGAVIA